MANSKFERNRSEMEIILGAGERFCRKDQRMTILYRLHNLPHRRVEYSDENYVDQDFVLNVTIGDRYILAQDEEEDHRSGESCYFGGFGSTDDDNDENYKKQRLFGDCYSKFVDPERHCQVGRDKSGLWIKDLGSKFGTFVNGIKLGVRVCHALKSGDLISLGFIYEEDKPLMLEIGHYWIFKVYEAPQSEYEHRNAVASEAMGNSVIVDTIFSNLNFQDLKRSRTVSKVWDEVAKRKLKPLSSVVFNLYDPKMDCNSFDGWSQQWFEEAQEKLLALQNIGIRSISFNENSSTLDFPTERLVFLQNMMRINNQITSVECDFLADSENVITLFKSILYCSQLSEITFSRMLFEEFDDYEEFETNASVRKLTFKENQSDYTKILQLFPNAREIELPNPQVIEDFLVEEYKVELDGVKVLKISNNKKQCESLYCYDCIFDDHFTRDNKLTIFDLSPLICALPYSMQLTSLEITDLQDTSDREDGGSVQQLYNLLSKFKNSLQYLKLGLFLKGNSHVKFPEMKMLKVFKLDFQDEPNADLPLLVSGFGSELFPRLETLEVTFGKFEEKLAEKFVKRNFRCVPNFKNTSVRKLRFVFPSKELKEEFSQMAEGNFREIFPNFVTFNFDYE